MIKVDEYLMGRNHENEYPLTFDLAMNLAQHLSSVNYIRGRYGQPLSVSSGYRPGHYNKAAGGSEKSSHQFCSATDFKDPLGDFTKWCLSNQHELEKAALYMEDPDHTPGWVHLQSRVPASGNRIFKP